MKKCKYFKLQEIVSDKVYKKLGESAWRLFAPSVIDNLDSFREIIGAGVTINNYPFGGPNTQRGLRCNVDQIVKDATEKNSVYLSSHCFGYGFDVSVKNMKGHQVFDYILKNQDKFPFISRMESRIDGRTKELRTYTHIEFGYRAPGKSIEVFDA